MMRIFTIGIWFFFLAGGISASAQAIEETLEMWPQERWYGQIKRVEERIKPVNLNHRERKITYVFDDYKRLVSKTFKLERWEYSYTDEGLLEREVRFFDGVMQEIWDWEWHEDSCLVTLQDPGTEEVLRRTALVLDSQDRVVFVETFSPVDARSCRYFATYSTDSVNVTTVCDSSAQTQHSYPFLNKMYVVKQVLNDFGLVFREVQYDGDNGYLEHFYRYDEFGNWIHKITSRFENGRRKLLRHVYREITYGEI